jgi:tetratricopeptide (TPR) repeat protein
MCGALTALGGAILLASRIPRLRWPIPLLGLVFFTFPEDAARAVVWIAGYHSAQSILVVLALGAGGALLKVAPGVSGPGGAWISAATVLLSAWAPTWALSLALAATALVAIRRPADPQAPTLRPLYFGAALAVTVAVLFPWAILRATIDPSAIGVYILVAAGLATGGLSRASGGDSATPAGATLGAAIVPLLIGLAPTTWIMEGTTGVAQAADPRVPTLRERSNTTFSAIDAGGASALREVGGRTYVELDGVWTDADTRQGRAERFGGTLAGCLTAARGRARVSGDIAGLVVAGLRAQGFTAIDTAVPSPGLARALAGRSPELDRTWLDASVRLLSLPGPFVARSGPAADVVVEVIRTPWSDAFSAPLHRRAVAATRRSLRDGGAHIAVISDRVGPDALRGILDAFAAAYKNPSLWLPPEGADTALVVGADATFPWSGLERCVAADARALRAVSLRSGVDVGALAMADAASVRALAAYPWPDPLTFSRRAAPNIPPVATLAAAGAATVDPDALFISAPAELASRADTRRLFLNMLTEATSGDARSAFEQARALAALPGGERALEPLLRPHLERARAAIARGTREGLASKAWEEAAAALANARVLAPDHAATRCLEGELAGGRGDLNAAEEAFAACTALDPDSVEAWQGLARARRSLGDMTGTEAALRTAARLDAQSWQPTHNLGLFLLDVQRYDEAERLLRQAMAVQARTDARIPVTSLALARLYLATRKPELALAQAQRAVALEPTATGLALRGAARLELREADLAEGDFAEALRLDTTNVLARFGMGQLHAVRGEYALAASDFKEVLARDPRNAEARANLQRLAPLIEDARDP